jgi:poly(3-hydroxybutyrate) depolymerase
MSHRIRCIVPGLLVCAILAACADEPAAPALPVLSIDPARVAVAGVSSGAYMATQVHLALNARVHGAALLSGGPYGCARGDLQTALDGCMVPKVAPPDVTKLAATVRERAVAGSIDPLSAFAGDRVWIFHGARDATVAPAMGAAAADLYRAVAPAVPVLTDFAREIGHVLPTIDAGADCIEGGTPWLGRCGFDAASAALIALFDAAPADPALPAQGQGQTVAFDQRRLFAADADPQLADEGFIYIPPQCAGGTCGLLLVFHGCQQSATQIGRSFVDAGGFNRGADAASVVVVYPQTRASWMPLNPKACWDWWGYTGADYDTRNGAQIRFVAALLDALTVRATR